MGAPEDNKNARDEAKSRKDRAHARRMGWICRVLAILSILIAVAGVILGYFVNYIGHDGEMRDGLGRMLDTVPEGFSLIMMQWAGFIWFFIDCILVFALVIFTDRMFVRSRVYFTGTRHVDF